jgi:cell division protein FtsA
MAKSTIYVGLEIGTSKICVVVGEVRPDGAIKILGVGQAPSRGVRKGEVVDFENAQACLHDALVRAEDRSDVMINNVFLAITGAHIKSFNNRGTMRIPEEQNEITGDDLEEVKEIARDVDIPQENVFLHSIVRDYYVDGQEKVNQPAGMLGKMLEADYHIIHCIKTRVQNTIRCVREIPLDVEDVVFSPVASAQVVLTQEHKDRGSLLIDIGGGTTDFVMYSGGSISSSGCIGVGGDHVTNDISVVMKIPLTKAEKLKVNYGAAILSESPDPEPIVIDDDPQLAGREIDSGLLNEIINARMTETLERLRDQVSMDGELEALGAGVFLTGGCSKLEGLDKLTEQIFNLPVSRGNIGSMSGASAAFENPQYSTPMGLIRYAQILEASRPKLSPIQRLGKKLGVIFRGTRLLMLAGVLLAVFSVIGLPSF